MEGKLTFTNNYWRMVFNVGSGVAAAIDRAGNVYWTRDNVLEESIFSQCRMLTILFTVFDSSGDGYY